MRNLEAEQKLLQKIYMLAGLVFLLGIGALAIGTEMLVLNYWESDKTSFWIWQGVWAVAQAVVISTIATTVKKQQTKE